jgi:hypothetical protein
MYPCTQLVVTNPLSDLRRVCTLHTLIHCRTPYLLELLQSPAVGVLDEPYSAKRAQLSIHAYRPLGYIGCTTVPAYID